jgi:hypothetical protein
MADDRIADDGIDQYSKRWHESHLALRNRKECFVSVRLDDGEYKHFKVPEEVYVYVRQLEHYIRTPADSRLLDRYPRLKGPANEKINR